MASSKLTFVPMNVLAQALRRSRTALCTLDEFTLGAECRQGKTSNMLTGRMLSIHLAGRQNIAAKSKKVAQMADYTADLQAAIASYAPDRQIITFSPAMLILPRDGERGNFETAVQMSYFFHEWIHYLHNVSTVHGMSAYSSFIGLWNAFRHTTGELGLGQGRFITSSAEELKTRAYLDVIWSTRRPADKPLFGEPSVDMCRIVSCKPAGNFNGIPDYLDVSVEVTNKLGDVVTYPKVIGPTEIVESVAYLLESHFLVRGFNHPPSSTRVFPYHTLTLLARHIAPELDDKTVLMCGLASLQSTFPTDAVIQFLKVCHEFRKKGEDAIEWLTVETVQQLSLNEPALRAGLKQIHDMFPVPGGVERAVKETVAFMEKNLDLRLDNPFFELDFVEHIREAGPGNFGQLMNRLVLTHGICSCRQERAGFDDEIVRDDLFNFAVAASDDRLTDARLAMLASVDFLISHLQADGSFRATADLQNRKCPFFSSCRESTRRDHATDCATQPWKSVHTRPANPCSYAQGVLHFRPGELKSRPGD